MMQSICSELFVSLYPVLSVNEEVHQYRESKYSYQRDPFCGCATTTGERCALSARALNSEIAIGRIDCDLTCAVSTGTVGS